MYQIITTLWQSSIFLTGMVLVNYVSYLILDVLLRQKSNNYISIEPENQRYVVKNLTKSAILFGLLISSLPGIWDIFFHNKWDNALIYRLGSIYVSTDLSGLLFVPKLSTATKIHHTCVIVLGLINVLVDYNEPGLHRAFVSLTLLSMIPYLVNTYLGMRYLEGERVKSYILWVCLYVYSASVILNCALQHLYVFYIVPDFSTEQIVTKSLYLLIYYFILNDDVKLIRYLNYKYHTHI